jgi:xanthine dehydrogenase molybdenum-binding subunit
MADTKHFGGKVFGQNYTTPDLVAKVTGKAKYAEDYRVDGMLFCKLLTSPMPHARVKRLDTSKAMGMPGVKAILTADDMPGAAAGATLGENVQSSAQAERGLTNEPLYQGEPILAIAATSELEAAEAIEAVDIEFEALPFVVDPIESLRPGGPNARTQGNIWVRPPAPPPGQGRGRGDAARGGRAGGPAAPPAPQIQVWKWTDEDFRNAKDGQLPLGKYSDEWSYGNVEEALAKADLVLDETFVTQSTGHRDARLLGVFVRDLRDLVAPLLVQLRDRQPKQLSFDHGVEPEIGFADGALHGADL